MSLANHGFWFVSTYHVEELKALLQSEVAAAAAAAGLGRIFFSAINVSGNMRRCLRRGVGVLGAKARLCSAVNRKLIL